MGASTTETGAGETGTGETGAEETGAEETGAGEAPSQWRLYRPRSRGEIVEELWCTRRSASQMIGMCWRQMTNQTRVRTR